MSRARRPRLLWVLLSFAPQLIAALYCSQPPIKPTHHPNQPTNQPIDHPNQRVSVTEQEIADGMLSVLRHHSKLIEGAAGCAVAAFWRAGQAGRLVGKRAVVLCCGGNVSIDHLKSVLERGQVLEA